MPSEFAFKLIFKYGPQGRWRFIVQRNPAVLWPMKTCTFTGEITKRRAQSLRMKMRNAELNLKGATVICKIARASVKVRKAKRLPLVVLRAQKRTSEQALYWPLVGSLHWDDRRTSVTTLYVSVVWAIEHFYKNKASHHKQRQFNCCFLSLFYFLSIISAFVTNIMSFIEALFWLRICSFRYMFCRRKSSTTCYFSTLLTLLLLTMVSVSHIYYRQIARFHCVCVNHRGCLIWGKFVKIPKPKFENQLTVINPCSVL